ncbi:hypothetical protein [Phenylobacterium sp.]|uniref:hypothetical protein n=1 Tax=Phenylobacterium sp. TaxID=1871053 RepID=UPI0035AE5626
MTDAERLAAVRTVHTVIYVVMALATLAVLYAGLTGASGPWLPVALLLVGIEAAVYLGAGLRCPLTAVAARYEGAAHVSDTWFPERFTRHTMKVFGPLLAMGLTLLAARLWLAHGGG